MKRPGENWLVERLVVGELMVNCYIIAWKPGAECVVIDPGGEARRIMDRIKALGVKVAAIVLTHAHGDHIGGVRELKSASGAPLVVGRAEAPSLADPWQNMSAQFGFPTTAPPADRLVVEGDEVEVGRGRLKVLETPGHSPGSITLVGDGFAAVGDLLFAGSIGRTDFPGGDLELLLRMIREKLFPLGDDCLILTGHGAETTIGAERRSNPFLQPGFNPIL